MPHVTWLDWYAEGAARRFANIRIPGFEQADDAQALWIMSVSALAQLAETNHNGDLLQDSALAQYVFFGSVASLVAPTGEAWNRCQQFVGPQKAEAIKELLHGGEGLKLSKKLVRSFAHAKAPDTQEWITTAKRHGWYFDLPHHALMLGGHQVRAILTHPSSLGSVSAVAVLTEPGSDEINGRYAWMLIGNADLPTGSGIDEAGVSREELRQRASDFIILALLYYQSLGDVPMLPRRFPTKAGKRSIQERLAHRSRSLFAVRSLPDPLGNLGRPSEPAPTSGQGWKLDHRVLVRGHFRWQPHGPERQLRRLIWIEPHERGADLAEKPPMLYMR